MNRFGEVFEKPGLRTEPKPAAAAKPKAMSMVDVVAKRDGLAAKNPQELMGAARSSICRDAARYREQQRGAQGAGDRVGLPSRPDGRLA